MAINKEHKEFHALDMSSGWETPAGYPAGIQQKILSGALDENNKKRLALAAVALRARRLHDQALRARILGRGLSRFGRPYGRQRRTGQGRRVLYTEHLCLTAARRLARSVQVRKGLPAVRNPLFRSGVRLAIDRRRCFNAPPRRNPASPFDLATRALRVVAGVLRLRPTKRGMPALTTAPIAAMSPWLIAASAVSCVPPSGASSSTMSAAWPVFKQPAVEPVDPGIVAGRRADRLLRRHRGQARQMRHGVEDAERHDAAAGRRVGGDDEAVEGVELHAQAARTAAWCADCRRCKPAAPWSLSLMTRSKSRSGIAVGPPLIWNDTCGCIFSR